MPAKSFRDLVAWQKSHQLVLYIYKLTEKYPTSEKFGLANQSRRCVVSITSNLAEGFARKSKKEKIQFYFISTGSISELQNQLIIANDVGYIKNSEFKQAYQLSIESYKLINSLIKGNRYP